MNRPRLHVVALSHLDTQWRWTVRDTVERFLPATVEANERLFERFPDYVLSFEGSYRYRLLAEHHPALFERVRERVATGRWHPAGAAVEAFDALLPAPESIVRQILHGRRWFRRELGRDSRDLFLPDCFGFPATLPTLAAHLGLIGFSTQKLRRGALMRSAFGIPFTFGRWRGPDGGEILAALDPGEYSGRIEGDLTRDAGQLARFAELTAAGVPPRRLLYVGIGDRGGAVPAETVHRLTAALAGDGPIEVRHGPSEQLFAETSDAERDALPSYAGELLLRVHATGCYTAKALLKRWNRRVEQLARIAETAVAAALVAGHPAPRRRLEDAWMLLLAHQMHDDLTGTAIPDAYGFTLADLGLAANELCEITLDAVATVAETLGSEGTGLSLLAVTPLGVAVDEVVEIADLPAGVTATEDADGERRAVQHLAGPAGASRALVSLTATGAGVQRLHLRSGVVAPPAGGAAEAGDGWLENGRYRAELGADGALRSLVDKRLRRELLAAPPELELLPDRSAKYPAWEILWSDASAPPRGRVDAALRVEIVERGPLRATLAVERRARGVVVRERWSLAAGGAGELLGAEIEIDWHRRASLLKARFELAAENDQALYDTGLGAIARPVASERLYEVPAQHWAAIVDRSGDFGVALFADARHGWDQPDGRTLRSTWIHAPRASFKWRHQATQDFGVHRFRFAVAGLPGDAVARGAVAALADRFVHRPWLGWHSRDGAGANDGAPRRKTLVSIPGPARLLALKAAEDDDRLVLRLSNPAASSCAPAIRSSLPELAQLTACCGMESPSSAVTSGTLLPAGIATLASAPIVRPDLLQTGCAPLGLPWSQRMATANGERGPGDGFDGDGRFLPLELLPARLDETVVPFDLEHGRRRRGDGLAARGETIELPAGSVEVWLLAAAVGGEREVEFALDGVACRLQAPDWRAPLLHEPKRRALLPATAAARFLRRPTAWSCGHLHDRRGHDLAVDRATLFALRVPAAGARRLRLPDCPELRIVAATVAGRTQRPLFDALPVELA